MLCSDFLTWKKVGKQYISKRIFHIFEEIECMNWSRVSDGWAGTCLLTLYFSPSPALGADPWALIAMCSLALGFTSFPLILAFSWPPWTHASSPSPYHQAWSKAPHLASPRGWAWFPCQPHPRISLLTSSLLPLKRERESTRHQLSWNASRLCLSLYFTCNCKGPLTVATWNIYSTWVPINGSLHYSVCTLAFNNEHYPTVFQI